MNTKIIYLFFFILSCGSNPEPAQEQNAQDHAMRLFTNPLILGASISAGYKTKDGGLSAVIAKNINPAAKITNEAQSGASSLESTQDLELSAYSPSIVMAVDIFFWDAVKNECGIRFEEIFFKIFESFRARGIPMILGKIPVNIQFPAGLSKIGIQSCSTKINSFLEENCILDNNCIIYDPQECIEAMASPISPEGLAYFSDDLHTTEQGNEFCAQEFIQSGNYLRLQ